MVHFASAIYSSVGVFMGDGAYDSADVYAAVEEQQPDALVIVPPRGDTSSFVRQTTLTQTKHEQGVMPRFGGGFRTAATV